MVTPEFAKLLTDSVQSLEETLKRAQEQMQINSRGAAITALKGVIDFVNAIPQLESQNLSVPLFVLAAALKDLEVGRVVAIMSPTAGFDNRKPEASLRKLIKAYTIHSIDELKSHGMALDDACRFVANQLEAAQVPSGGQLQTPSWKTLKNWRYDVKKRPADDDQERNTLEAMRAEAQFPPEMPLEQLKRRIAALLQTILPQIRGGSE